MRYLATIKYEHNSHSQDFRTLRDAEDWLDSMNSNKDYTTYIEEYNDNWEKIDGFFYTEAKR